MRLFQLLATICLAAALAVPHPDQQYDVGRRLLARVPAGGLAEARPKAASSVRVPTVDVDSKAPSGFSFRKFLYKMFLRMKPSYGIKRTAAPGTSMRDVPVSERPGGLTPGDGNLDIRIFGEDAVREATADEAQHSQTAHIQEMQAKIELQKKRLEVEEADAARKETEMDRMIVEQKAITVDERDVQERYHWVYPTDKSTSTESFEGFEVASGSISWFSDRDSEYSGSQERLNELSRMTSLETQKFSDSKAKSAVRIKPSAKLYGAMREMRQKQKIYDKDVSNGVEPLELLRHAIIDPKSGAVIWKPRVKSQTEIAQAKNKKLSKEEKLKQEEALLLEAATLINKIKTDDANAKPANRPVIDRRDLTQQINSLAGPTTAQAQSAEADKDSYQKCVYAWEAAQAKASELVFPVIERMTEGVSNMFIWDAAYSIYAELTASPVQLQGPFSWGWSLVGLWEAQLFNGTGTTYNATLARAKARRANLTRAEVARLEVATAARALETVYLFYFDQAYVALNESGVLADMATLSANLMANDTSIVPKSMLTLRDDPNLAYFQQYAGAATTD